jgi:serine/threonine protein phosphatase PrpC
VNLDIAIRIVPANRVGEDRAAAFTIPNGHVLVLADGAGGTSGGAAAADAVVARASISSLTCAPDCVHVLETVDRALAELGQTTAILLVVSNGGVFGGCVGDSSAWLVDGSGTLDLTENQNRKPLLGSGRAKPAPFGPFDFRGRVLIGSDGLFKYVDLDRIREIVANLPVRSVPDALVAAARLPSGGLQDDIAIIVAAQQAVEADGRTSSRPAPPPSRPW